VHVNRSLCQKSVLPDMHNDMSKEAKEQILTRLRRRCITAGLEHKEQVSPIGAVSTE